MLTELCQELRNWFMRDIFTGTITIDNGEISFSDGKDPGLLPKQYYRIVGSVFSDGVHQFGEEQEGELTDETFVGALWTLAIPKEVVSLADEIAAWRAVYEATDSQAMSPYNSESFGGYSYSKSGTGSSGSSETGSPSWKSVFKSRLNIWRKIL